MTRLPERIESDRLVVRLWRPEDAGPLNRAIERSADHLRPWMPWVSSRPDTDDERRERIDEWQRTWDGSGEAVYGILDRDGNVVGGTGLHRRSPDPTVLDIGYWIHVDHVRKGYAAETAAALVEAAFAMPSVRAIDIHHDKANVASAGVPTKLGFAFVGERPDEITSPGEVGIDCHWRLTRPLPEEVVLRTATPEDRDAIVDLVREAFSHHGRDGQEEVDIVLRTWELDAAPDGLEVVAVDADELVGHVLCARGDLGDNEVVAVAPLCVSPARHGRGIGGALMRELISRAQGQGWPLVALLGSPVYYGRFGFEPSGPLGITYPVVGADSPYFQVLRLSTYDETVRGDFAYCWER